jgi:hypothetical protein
MLDLEYEDLFEIGRRREERLAEMRAREELERPLPVATAITVQLIPSIPYAGCWDGQQEFSRSICSGNYHFGAEVVGEREPVVLTFDNGRGRLATRDGWRAVDDVHVAVWHGGKRREYDIPASGLWMVLHLNEEVEDWACVEVALRPWPEFTGQVDSWGRW